MKPSSTLILPLAATLLLAASAGAQPGKAGLGIESLPASRTAPPVKPVGRDQVLQRLKRELPSTETPTDSKTEKWDAVRGMDVIGYNGDITLVPKGSIVHVPQRLRENVGVSSGSILSWIEFATRYPAVVERIDVTIEQASGAKAIEPSLLASIAKSDRIVVAVLNGGPVSLPHPAATAAPHH